MSSVSRSVSLRSLQSAQPEPSHSMREREAVAASLKTDATQTTAELLKALRQQFPELPLAERLAVLAALSRN